MRTIRAKGQWPKLDILYAVCTQAKLMRLDRPHRRAWDAFCLSRDQGWFEIRAVTPMRPKRTEQDRLAAHDPDGNPGRKPINFHRLRSVSSLMLRQERQLFDEGTCDCPQCGQTLGNLPKAIFCSIDCSNTYFFGEKKHDIDFAD